MVVEHVREVGGGLAVEGFVGEEEDLEIDSVQDREPVYVLQDRGYMFMGAGVGEETGGRVLDVLEFVEDCLQSEVIE